MGLSCILTNKNEKSVYLCNKGLSVSLLKFFREEGFDLNPDSYTDKRYIIINFDYVYDNRFDISKEYKIFYDSYIGPSKTEDYFKDCLSKFESMLSHFAGKMTKFYFC